MIDQTDQAQSDPLFGQLLGRLFAHYALPSLKDNHRFTEATRAELRGSHDNEVYIKGLAGLLGGEQIVYSPTGNILRTNKVGASDILGDSYVLRQLASSDGRAWEAFGDEYRQGG